LNNSSNTTWGNFSQWAISSKIKNALNLSLLFDFNKINLILIEVCSIIIVKQIKKVSVVEPTRLCMDISKIAKTQLAEITVHRNIFFNYVVLLHSFLKTCFFLSKNIVWIRFPKYFLILFVFFSKLSKFCRNSQNYELFWFLTDSPK